METNPTNQKLTDEGSFGKYFHIMLNMWDDDLDPFSYRLLGHYRRVCGTKGHCTEAIRTTAHVCQMSLAKARSTRQMLKTLGYINFDEQTNGRSIVITLIDQMEVNVQRYLNAKNGRGIKSTTPTKSDTPTPTKFDTPGIPNLIPKEDSKNSKELNTVSASALPIINPIIPISEFNPMTVTEMANPIPDPTPSPNLLADLPKPAPIKVPRKASPSPLKQAKKSASLGGARAGRKPQRSDPFWNAWADTFYQGARNGNQRLARVMFGQKDHGLFGLIAYECEHQNCQEDKLDYQAMALWVPKFYAALPKDNGGKTIELRDPAKAVERWIGWRESSTTRINCPPLIFYDPQCPHRQDVEKCEEGWILKTLENGERTRVPCECQIKIRQEKGLKW